MPGKSRRRHPPRSKKRKMRQGFPVTGAQQQATAEDDKPVSQAPTPSARALTPRSALPSIVQHPYITTELRRIAILAGVMLAILVVLYLVIS